MLEVYKDVKYGEEVFVSKTAEKGRRNGCLCINGCRHFLANKAWQNAALKLIALNMGHKLETKKEFENFCRSAKGQKALRMLVFRVTINWFLFTNAERRRYLKNMAQKENKPCPIATSNFGVCFAGGITNGVARCPYFLPDEKRVRVIDKPNEDAN